jgi:hypothetical protein
MQDQDLSTETRTPKIQEVNAATQKLTPLFYVTPGKNSCQYDSYSSFF